MIRHRQQQHSQSRSFIPLSLSLSLYLILPLDRLLFCSPSFVQSALALKLENVIIKPGKNKWEKRAFTPTNTHIFAGAHFQIYKLRFSPKSFLVSIYLFYLNITSHHTILRQRVCVCRTKWPKIFTLMCLVSAHCERILISTINLISLIACSQSI